MPSGSFWFCASSGSALMVVRRSKRKAFFMICPLAEVDSHNYGVKASPFYTGRRVRRDFFGEASGEQGVPQPRLAAQSSFFTSELSGVSCWMMQRARSVFLFLRAECTRQFRHPTS